MYAKVFLLKSQDREDVGPGSFVWKHERDAGNARPLIQLQVEEEEGGPKISGQVMAGLKLWGKGYQMNAN